MRQVMRQMRETKSFNKKKVIEKRGMRQAMRQVGETHQFAKTVVRNFRIFL